MSAHPKKDLDTKPRGLSEIEEAAAIDEQLTYDAEAAAFADDDQRAYERSHAAGRL